MAAEITAAYKEKTGYDYEVSYSDFALACVDVYSFSEGASIDFVKGVLDSFYEELVLKEAVIAPLYTKSNANLINTGVSGIEFHPVALNRVYKNATVE